MNKKIDITIVIPAYNEEKNVERFPKELIEPLKKLGRSFEIIAVDDGSTNDNTWDALKKIAQKYDEFIALKHSRNYGMGAAYQTAIDNSSGEYVITYSADLEIPSKYIKKVIKELDKGMDVVNTNRKGRWKKSALSTVLRRLPSKLANMMIKSISGIEIRDTGSGLKGFRSFVTNNLKIYGDMHRFLLAYSTLYTKKIIEIDVEYKDRRYGTSAYGSLTRTFSVFLDLFALNFMLKFATKPFSMMPGRIFGSIGLLSFAIGLIISFYLVLLKFIYNQDIGERPLFIIGVFMVILGVQLVMTGLLGELLMRTYFESSKRKPYIVSERA